MPRPVSRPVMRAAGDPKGIGGKDKDDGLPKIDPKDVPKFDPKVFGKGSSDSSVPFPRLPITVDGFPELGILLIRAANPKDLEAALAIIEYIKKAAEGAEIDIRIVPLAHLDPVSVINILNPLFNRVILGVRGTTNIRTAATTGGAPGAVPGGAPGGAAAPAVAGSAATAVNIVFLPLARQNAILMAAPKARVDDIIKEIRKIDVPSAPEAKTQAFSLKQQPANRVANLLTSFYADRYPAEGRAQNMVRITWDDSTNMIFVQAAPSDMEEIRSLIERVDTTTSGVEMELKIIQLRTAVSEELANILLRAISDTFTGTGATGGAGGLGLPGGGGPGGFTPGTGTGIPTGGLGTTGLGGIGSLTRQSKSIRIKFETVGKAILQSGVLEDIRITAEPRINSLIVSAPAKTMQLIEALVKELDQPPAARSEINIFTLKRADATQMALTLQQLFLGSSGLGTAGRVGAGVPGVPGLPGAGGGAALGQPRPLVLTLSGKTPEGIPIIDLRLTVDERTNSMVVAGSRNDLDIIEAIISRLEDADAQPRRNFTYRLKNAQAADIAASLNDFLTKTKQVGDTAGLTTLYQTVSQQVVITPDPISNTLLISATREYFDDIIKIIQQLDQLPPQVAIQVLVAEVDLSDTTEIGVEFGLQSPILFQRGIIPGGTSGDPGFNFNTVVSPLPNANATAGPGIVGFQGLNNLAVGRVSPNAAVGGFVFSAASESFNLLIRSLKLQSRLDILSRPQVMTLDGQSARIAVGQNVPYVDSTTLTGTGFAQQGFQRKDVGVLLEVTPKINPDGTVLLRVIPEISSVVPTPVNLGNGVLGTAFNIQRIETTVIASDGETVALGGLISKRDTKQENKIPWLGDLPGVGALFRFRQHLKSKTELIIIMTPHIVRCRADAERVLAEEARRMDWVLGDVYKIHGHHTERIFNPAAGPLSKGLPLPPYSPAGMPGPGFAPPGMVPGTVPPVIVPESAPLPRPLPKEASLPLPGPVLRTSASIPAGPVLPPAHSLIPAPVFPAPAPAAPMLPPAGSFSTSTPAPLPPLPVTGPSLTPPPAPGEASPETSSAPPPELSKTLSTVDSWTTRIPLPGQDLPMETNRVFTSRYPLTLPASGSVTRTVIGPLGPTSSLSHGREYKTWPVLR